MQIMICDLCPPQEHATALYRVSFNRVGPGALRMPDGDTSSDRPIDMCQKHYDEIFQAIMGLAGHA